MSCTTTDNFVWVRVRARVWVRVAVLGQEPKEDKLAKLCTTSNLTLKCPVPQSYINNYFNNKVLQVNNEHWIKNGPKHTKMIRGGNYAKTIKNLNSAPMNNRKYCRTAVQLISGHCGLNKHQGIFTLPTPRGNSICSLPVSSHCST